LKGETIPWRSELLYEYFWERNFPHTPTLHALRGDRYKYVHVQGLWDIDELYDLETDPGETKNLIFSKELAPIVKELNKKLFTLLEETNGMYIPLQPDRGGSMNLRTEHGSPAAEFPEELIRKKPSQETP
jgi:N-acetylglucosamine-6-sulfatase